MRALLFFLIFFYGSLKFAGELYTVGFYIFIRVKSRFRDHKVDHKHYKFLLGQVRPYVSGFKKVILFETHYK